MTTTQLLAKVNRNGAVWRSRIIGRNRSAYQLEAIGSTRTAFTQVDAIEVRPADDSNGWDVVLRGDIVEHHRTKFDAQRAAEALLDNPRDAAGWLIPTTGAVVRA
jgi:hypothetical protein